MRGLDLTTEGFGAAERPWAYCLKAIFRQSRSSSDSKALTFRCGTSSPTFCGKPFSTIPTPQQVARARDFFEQALALDAQNVEALVGAATVELQTANILFTDDRTERLAAAEAAAIKALSLAPNHAHANRVLGSVQMHTNRVPLGIAQCERALALDRNLADAHGYIGMGKYFIGRGAETEGHVQEALRLSPRDMRAYLWTQWAGVANLSDGADAEAVVWLRRSIETKRNYPLQTSGMPLPSRTLVNWMRHERPHRWVLRFSQASPSGVQQR
jgi:tetratricopeptide (TPR) repeat protein